MTLARLVPIVMVAALGCRLENPAFEDGGGGDEQDEVFGDGSSEAPEAGSSLGETVEGDDPVDGDSGSTDTNGTNDSIDGSSDDVVDTSSEGPSEGSSEGVVDTSSEEDSSSTSESTSSDDGMSSSSDGLDAPDLLCPMIVNESTCMECIQNHCCGELDVDCITGVDDKCYCTLECLSTNGDNCAINCGAGPLAEDHAAMIHECGVMSCALCN